MRLNYDAVVIGAGISGLTSALLLARRGKKTAVLEAGVTLSPLMHGFTRKGVHFETGFHYASNLEEGGFGPYIFAKLGLDLKPFPLPREGYDEIRLLPTGRVFKMICGEGELQKKLSQAFPRESVSIAAYLEKTAAAIAKSAYINMQNGGGDFDNIIDSPPTLQEVLDAHFKSPELKAILSISSFLHGTPPEKISFAQHCCIACGLYKSAWGIEGGGRAINAAYCAALKNAGADIFLNSEAAEITQEGNQKIITLKDDRQFACDICVAAVHPKIFLRIAPPEVYREGYKARLQNLQETPGFFALYGVLNQKTFFETGNIFVVKDLDINKIFLGDGKSYYINFSHSRPQAVSIISLVPPDSWQRGPDYENQKAAYVQEIKQDIKNLFPQIADNIEYLGSSTPATMRAYCGYGGGYGLMHDVNKTKILPMTKIPGLYLTGQSVIAPGFLGALITSLVVDRVIK
ncbi:MAG: NAD(P)/FAD-dependent oxidoreductase [Elusimicrobiota bacterium]|jgi:all-trans-retinol 13,14-reductase|nr:NAD(P)/FAD-dependent oxidoreductase [Elusimicrobiota bacterium]